MRPTLPQMSALATRARTVLAALTLALAGCAHTTAPDLIVHGGPILTVNGTDDIAQAMAVRDGVIVTVGSQARVLAEAGPTTEIIDLKGRAVLPGFVGAHEHPSITAVFNGAIDLSGFTYKTNEQVWQALRDAVTRAPRGDWIYAGGLDAILTPDLKIPSRLELDAIAPDNPLVLVSQSLHSFWANSRAFEEAGITRNTADPGTGSYYERDSHGELTGFVAETRAGAPLLKELKSPWKMFRRYGDVLDDLLANGFTSVASLGYNVPPLLARVAASHRWQPRIRQFNYLIEDELQYLPASPANGNDYFRVLGVKLWHDGSPYTGSMYTSAPYLDSALGKTLGIAPGSHGAAMMTQDALVEKIRTYTRAGWQVAIHSQGDASNRAVLQAIEQAGALPGRAPVVRLEHGVFLPRESVDTLAKLGVTPSFHIHHIRYYGNALADAIVGHEAASHSLPVRSAFESKLHPTLHADSPMFPARGFALMQTAIDRKTGSDRTLNADESITIREALRAMTVNGAYQLRLHDRTGSLEAGKWADFQIVDRNPYEVPVAELDKVRVQAVYVGGARKFHANATP